MKIIFVSPELPYPLDTGGKIRSFNILKNLAQEHQIILVCFGEKKDLEPLSNYAQKIIILPLKLSLPIKILNFCRSFFSRIPMKVLNFYSKEMVKRLKEGLKEEKPDVLYFEHIYLAQYIEEITQKEKYFKIFDTHNIYFRFFEHLSKSKNWLKALVNRTQIEKMKKYEAKISSLFDLVLVCSEEEKEILKSISPKARIEIVPNGVNFRAYQKLKSPKRKENALLFIGSFDHFPNQEGVIWFAKRIFPKIKEKVKNVKLYLIGRNPPFSILKFKKDPAISVLGYIKEIKPYFLKSKIFIVPLLSGGGTRLKILEAMAVKIPVVSTKIGAQGIEVLDGQNIFLADSEDDFAQKILDLFSNEKLSQRIIKNAYKLVMTKYDWSICIKKLREKLSQLN